MNRISRIISLSLFIPLLFSCFKKKEEPFCVTYKVDGYSERSYVVNIVFTDSTGHNTWVKTTDQHWSRKVSLPKEACASLVVYPSYSKEQFKQDFEKGLICNDITTYISAKITSGDRRATGEGSKIITLVMLPKDGI